MKYIFLLCFRIQRMLTRQAAVAGPHQERRVLDCYWRSPSCRSGGVSSRSAVPVSAEPCCALLEKIQRSVERRL